MTKIECIKCSYCLLEPDASYPVCCHPTVMVKNMLGLYVYHVRKQDGPCGPEAILFEKHPLRDQ